MEQRSQEAPRPVEVTIRRFELSDVDSMTDWASDLLDKPREPSFIRDFVFRHPWFRAICLAGVDRHVGSVSVTPTGDPRRAELGYVLARAHWGKGVATAAVKRTVATVFDEMEGLERLEALVDVANTASQHVLEKAGFRREAVLPKYRVIKGAVKDIVMFSFLITDPLVDCTSASTRQSSSKKPERQKSLTMEQRNRETPRAVEVTLRPFEISDVDAMMVWASDPQVAAVCRWDVYESTEHVLAFIRDVMLPHPWSRAICLAGEDWPVGAVSVTPTGDPCRAELGYVLARAHWGKGVATAAVKRTVATVFDEMEGLERVEAVVDVANPASQRVLEKAGFTKEAVLRKYGAIKGVVKDMVMFSFINTDPFVE
ncbi:hypothetical protein EJB05_04088, partial [Eragrostis curvula]